VIFLPGRSFIDEESHQKIFGAKSHCSNKAQLWLSGLNKHVCQARQIARILLTLCCMLQQRNMTPCCDIQQGDFC
jgi:hypothetical protein